MGLHAFRSKKIDFSFLSVLMVHSAQNQPTDSLEVYLSENEKKFIFRPILKILWSWMLTSLLRESPFLHAGQALTEVKIG